VGMGVLGGSSCAAVTPTCTAHKAVDLHKPVHGLKQGLAADRLFMYASIVILHLTVLGRQGGCASFSLLGGDLPRFTTCSGELS
jgi:hypothetical protein